MKVEEWLSKDNQLGIDIWHKKYQNENETFDEWLDRVSGSNEEVRQLIIDKKFLFGGRILAGRGIEVNGRKVTTSNCFLPGMKVLTNNGYKNIEEITTDDMVLSHTNKWCKVNATMQRPYQGEIYKISSKCFLEDIYCTPNHKFLTDENEWVEAKDLCCRWSKKSNTSKLKSNSLIINQFTPKVVYLSDNFIPEDNTKLYFIEEQKLVGISRFVNDKGTNVWRKPHTYINNEFIIDDEFSYVIGRWIGDGSVTARKGDNHPSIWQIVFNASKDKSEVEYCKNILQNKFPNINISTQVTRQNTIVLIINNTLFATWFKNNFGMYSNCKFINNDIVNKFYVLLGILDSDGSVHKEHDINITLKNKQLVEWIRQTLYNYNINASIIKEEHIAKYPDNTYYKLRVSKNQSSKLLSLMKKHYDDDRMESDNNYAIKLSNIDIIKDFNGVVYNLSVEQDNSYIVNGAIVHNCFVITPPDDSIESIFDTAKKMARTYSRGGGCGTDLSKLSPKGAKVRNAAEFTDGPIPFMDLFSTTTAVIGTKGRRGALMLTLDCDHPDIEDFIDVKRDLNKVTKANISIKFKDYFIKKALTGENIDISFTRKETGEVITKTINPYNLMQKMALNNYEMGEPGALFWDRIKDWNLNSNNEEYQIVSTNPCGEQPLISGGSCNLGSLNLSEFVKDGKFDYDDFRDAVRIAIDGLNEALEDGMDYLPLKEQREASKNWHNIGLGIMGLADALIKMKITYGSEQAVNFCKNLAFELMYSSLKESALLAKKYGCYPKCDKKKLIKSDFMQNIFYYMSEDDECELNALIDKYGLRNCALLTIAPTGTLSTMLGVSGGIEPIFANYYTRKTESLNKSDEPVYYKVYTPIVKEYMENNNITNDSELPSYFVTSHEINYMNRVYMQGAWQEFVDASISSTINLPNDVSVDDIYNIYINAWRNGLKGVTVYRDGCSRTGILTTDTDKKIDNHELTSSEEFILPRGYIIKTDDEGRGLIGKKKTLHTGCGSLHITTWWDEATGDLMEIFIDKGSKGGCNSSLNGLSRLISLAARGGVDIDSIIDQLGSIVTCASFSNRRMIDKTVSPGDSCPSAIGKMLQRTHDEVMSEIFEEEDYTIKEKQPQKIDKPSMKPIMQIEKCPECGEPISYEGGCRQCHNCGWSKCS